MELCFEYTRRFDLIRWGDYYKLMQEQVDKAQADESWKFRNQCIYLLQYSEVLQLFPDSCQ